MNHIKIVATFLFVIFLGSIILPAHATPIPAKNDRIGWSADGNQHDPDDWGATAIALAVFAKAGWQDKLVHIDYNNWLPENTPLKAEQERISMVEGTKKFKFANTKLFDCQNDLDKAVDNVVAEINKSSENSKFWYVQAGPFEVAYMALMKADPEKRKYCILVSHSAANDRPEHWPGQHGSDDCIALGAKYYSTTGQGGDKFGSGKFKEWHLVDWMKDSPNPEYRWVYSRLQKTAEHKHGVLDASDGGMAYVLVTGDVDGNFNPKLKDFLGEDWKKSSSVKENQKPNIILLMADDLGWGDVGFNGNTIIKTPGLDQLASEGVVFERFYTASCICSPTRGSCLTGRHPYRYGVLSAHTAGMRQGEITIAEIASEKGYATGIFGKWHLGYVHPSQQEGVGYYSPPSIHGFDETFVTKSAIPTWDPLITPKGWNKWGMKEGEPWKNGEFYYHNGELVSDNLEGDDSRVIMDRVLPFIQKSANAEKPFLACVWFHTPHEPVVAGPGYRAMYSNYPEKMQHYYGSVTAMDEQISRLNKELARLGIKNNTLVFFCSDNGPAGGAGSAGSYRGRKHTPYEGGLRVPALAVWPGLIEAGVETDVMVGTVDYFPTIAEIIGYKFPKKLERTIDGISLMANLQGGRVERTAPMFCGYRRLFKNEDPKAYIQNQYKLLQNRKGVWELYNLETDPKEKINLIEQKPQIASKMLAEIEMAEKSIQRSLNGGDYQY